MMRFPSYKFKVSPRLLERRQREVDRTLNVLGRTDTKVVLTTDVRYAVANTEIKINPKLSDKEFSVTLAHEIIHAYGVPHTEITRRLGYSSKSLRKDTLSKAFSDVIRSKSRGLN